MRNNYALWGLLLTLPLTSTWLQAQTATAPAAADGVKAEQTQPPDDKFDSFWKQDYLTGDWGGARSRGYCC